MSISIAEHERILKDVEDMLPSQCKELIKACERRLEELKKKKSVSCVICMKPTEPFKVQNSDFYLFALCDSCFELQKEARKNEN